MTTLGLAQADRWTCSTCLKTEVPPFTTDAARLHRSIVRIQKQHAHDHAVERMMLRIGRAA